MGDKNLNTCYLKPNLCFFDETLGAKSDWVPDLTSMVPEIINKTWFPLDDSGDREWNICYVRPDLCSASEFPGAKLDWIYNLNTISVQEAVNENRPWMLDQEIINGGQIYFGWKNGVDSDWNVCYLRPELCSVSETVGNQLNNWMSNSGSMVDQEPVSRYQAWMLDQETLNGSQKYFGFNGVDRDWNICYLRPDLCEFIRNIDSMGSYIPEPLEGYSIEANLKKGCNPKPSNGKSELDNGEKGQWNVCYCQPNLCSVSPTILNYMRGEE